MSAVHRASCQIVRAVAVSFDLFSRSSLKEVNEKISQTFGQRLGESSGSLTEVGPGFLPGLVARQRTRVQYRWNLPTKHEKVARLYRSITASAEAPDLEHYLDSFVIHIERSIGAYHETFEFLESGLGILVRLYFSGQFCGCVLSPSFDILPVFSQ